MNDTTATPYICQGYASCGEEYGQPVHAAACQDWNVANGFQPVRPVAQDYTQTTETINGVAVTVYGGTKRPVLTYALPGHVTGWSKRHGARVTYAELTCTCHLVGEAVAVEDGHPETWISYGQEGWMDRLNAQALAHVTNVTANAFMVRPAKGDRSRWADRRRVNLQGLRDAMERAGLRHSELQAHIQDVKAGHVVHAEDGTRFELASDRASYIPEERRLPIS